MILFSAIFTATILHKFDGKRIQCTKRKPTVEPANLTFHAAEYLALDKVETESTHQAMDVTRIPESSLCSLNNIHYSSNIAVDHE